MAGSTSRGVMPARRATTTTTRLVLLAALGAAAALHTSTTAFNHFGGLQLQGTSCLVVGRSGGTSGWALGRGQFALSAKKRRGPKQSYTEDEMSFFDEEEDEGAAAAQSAPPRKAAKAAAVAPKRAATTAAATSAADSGSGGYASSSQEVGAVFGETLLPEGLEWDAYDWEDPVDTAAEEYGLDDLDFDELQWELEEERRTNSGGTYAINGGSGGPSSMSLEEYYESGVGGADMRSDRELEDILMERSLRFYDPKVTGEREKAYLVGLEARGYATAQRDRQASEAAAARARAHMSEDERAAAAADDARRRRSDWEERFTLEESLSELSELAGTAGLEVVGTTYQRVVEPNPRTYIGTGKVKEVKRAMRALGCKTVIIDHELSPGQQRSLEAEFGGEEEGIKVLDRTALILDIFAQHARTREGQLQVELALHLYRLPRLTKLWTHLERQSGAAGAGGGKSGGVGLRGPGERQLEVDRRLLKEKITDLQRMLRDVRRHRTLHRRRREKLGLPIVALVGYTNAGKSTVLNALTSAGVLAEDMLFATLDPTTRRVKLPGLKVHPEIMLTDTVGFIQKLPTNLVAAFRATLEEVQEADVIVHVCDVSNGAWPKQHRAVLQVLHELDALEGTPVVTLWNKLDLLPAPEREEVVLSAATEHDMTVAASARTGAGMDDFVAMLEVALGQLLEPVEAVVPYSKGDLLSRIHELGACDVEEYQERGCFIRARVPDELMNRLEPYWTDGFREERRRAAQARLMDGGASAAQLAAEMEEAEWREIAKGRHASSKQP